MLVDNILLILQDSSNRLSVFFSSETEMFFYIFCFIAFHMIMVNMFYGKPSRRKYKTLNLKRSVLIIMLVAEIVIFTNLLTMDYMANTIMPDEFSSQGARSVYNGYQH